MNPSRDASFTPVSLILQQLHDQAPADHFTLGWLMNSLHQQSFGLIMLVLSIIGVAPGICVVAGPLLIIVAFQMIAGRPAPTFPRWIACRRLSTRRLGAVLQRAIPMLRYLEKIVHPRHPIPLEATKRFVGIAVIILSVRMMLNPIPLSNIIPAAMIGLIALAYLEEDGLIIWIGILSGFIILAVDLGLAWELVHGGERMSVGALGY